MRYRIITSDKVTHEFKTHAQAFEFYMREAAKSIKESGEQIPVQRAEEVIQVAQLVKDQWEPVDHFWRLRARDRKVRNGFHRSRVRELLGDANLPCAMCPGNMLIIESPDEARTIQSAYFNLLKDCLKKEKGKHIGNSRSKTYAMLCAKCPTVGAVSLAVDHEEVSMTMDFGILY